MHAQIRWDNMKQIVFISLIVFLLTVQLGTSSEVSQLTNDSMSSTHPWWSPDGRKIAFQSGPIGEEAIWLMNIDGTGKVQLTDNTSNVYPHWSPDGKKILFTSLPNGISVITLGDSSKPAPGVGLLGVFVSLFGGRWLFRRNKHKKSC